MNRSNITAVTLQKHLEEAVPALLKMARELSWNNISDNCRFILSEIKNHDKSFFELQRLTKKENDKKTPVKLGELVPELLRLYDDLYDINLHIYRATRKLTIIDIRYYPRSALDKDYRLTVKDIPPMLHCKVPSPPWRTGKQEKFDINWERKIIKYRWNMFWLRLQGPPAI